MSGVDHGPDLARHRCVYRLGLETRTPRPVGAEVSMPAVLVHGRKTLQPSEEV